LKINQFENLKMGEINFGHSNAEMWGIDFDNSATKTVFSNFQINKSSN